MKTHVNRVLSKLGPARPRPGGRVRVRVRPRRSPASSSLLRWHVPPSRRAVRARVRRTARRRRRGRRRPAHLRGRRPRRARRLRGRCDVQVGPRPGARAVAEPHRGRGVLFDGDRLPAGADRAGDAATRSTASCAGRTGRASSASRRRVAVEHVLHPQPGYPFTLRLRVEYVLGADGLTVHTSAENVGDARLPVRRRASPVHRGADRPRRRHGGRRRVARRRRSSTIRSGWTRRGGSRSTTSPSGPTRRGSTSSSSRAIRCRDVDRRSLAVEPMTCPPNAFRTGEDLLRLEPGETFAGAWGIAVRVKKRLDVLLVERGLAESRAQAQALVLAGLVPGYDKAGAAGRRGRRARGRAAAAFRLPRRREARERARRARRRRGRRRLPRRRRVDGRLHGLPAPARRGARDRARRRLRPAPPEAARRPARRPCSSGRTRARSTELPFAPQLVVCDVSFISVRTALPPVLRLAAPGWQALVLVKPQFEAGRAEVREGRRPRPGVRARVLREVASRRSAGGRGSPAS